MPRQQYDNTNRLAVWANDKKRDAKDRDLNGNVIVECPHCREKTDYWVSLWENVGGSASAPVLSGNVAAKDAPVRRAPQRTAPEPAPRRYAAKPLDPERRYGAAKPDEDPMNQDIPF